MSSDPLKLSGELQVESYSCELRLEPCSFTLQINPLVRTYMTRK